MAEEHEGEVLNFLEAAIVAGNIKKIWEIFTQAHRGSTLKKAAEEALFELCSDPENLKKLKQGSLVAMAS